MKWKRTSKVSKVTESVFLTKEENKVQINKKELFTIFRVDINPKQTINTKIIKPE